MSRSLKFAGSLVLLAAVLVGGGLVSRGQDPDERPDAQVEQLQAQTDEFLSSVAKRNAQTAFDNLLDASPLDASTVEVKNLILKAEELTDKYGAYNDHELVQVKRVGESLVLLRYLYKCDNHPVVWHFTYYKPSSASPWVLVTLRFDTRLELLTL